MDLAAASISIRIPLKLPVRVWNVDGVPKLLAGGIPVTPINVALQRRQQDKGATLASLETYSRAARLYVEFCAYRDRALIGITNEEFHWYKDALLGLSFPDAKNKRVQLNCELERRTADLMLTLIYSIASDIEQLYSVSFDWRRYKDSKDYSRSRFSQRTHSISWESRKIIGLPDDQFAKLLRAAKKQWGSKIASGDMVFASEPEMQRGALFYRNVALLFVLRYAGSRRSEAPLVTFNDIDRAKSMIYLTTKGHRVEAGRCLPVILFPWVRDTIWLYATRFRPVVSDVLVKEQQTIFVSHSLRNYGRGITATSVRKLIDTLRPELEPPWNKLLTPHTLRHAFGYDLQKHGGTAAVTTNMRHKSIRSSEPYAAGPEIFADELIPASNERIERLLALAGLTELFK